MRNAWLWIVLVVALGAVAWFFFGDSLGVGPGPDPADDLSLDDSDLVDGTDAVTLAAKGTAAKSADAMKGATDKAQQDALARGGLIIRGRCVDEARHPRQTTVVVSIPGCDVVETTTGTDGRFAVAVGELEMAGGQLRGTVHATTEDDLIGFHLFWLWPVPDMEESDAGVVVLGKGEPLSVRVTNAGAAVPNARVALFGSGNWGNRALMSEDVTDEHGLLSFPLVPIGSVTVFAGGPLGTGRGQTDSTLPRADAAKPLEIELTEERVLDVEVVDKETGDPVVGAQLRVTDTLAQFPPLGPGYRPLPAVMVTNEQGHALVRGLSSRKGERVRIAVVADGYPAGIGRGIARGTNTKYIKAGVTEVRFELAKLRTVTFPIKAGDVAPPPEGSTLTVEQRNWGPVGGQPGTMTATVQSGQVVIEGMPARSMSGAVVAPDGSIATFRVQAGKDEGGELTFARGYRLHVRVLQADGAPLVGRRVTFQGRGGGRFSGGEKTDENGEALLPPSRFSKGEIRVFQDAMQWWSAITVDTVDLTTQEGIHVVTMPLETKLTVSLRLDGKARLPARYWLIIDRRLRESEPRRRAPKHRRDPCAVPATQGRQAHHGADHG